MFQFNPRFGVDISGWDVSRCSNFYGMFEVRAPNLVWFGFAARLVT